MTSVAVRDVPELVHEGEPLRTPTIGLAAWAESARQAASVAVSLAKTPFVPQSLREKPQGKPDAAELARCESVTAANITAAILTGQELGLEPMAAMRSLDIIQGTPALRAVALRAIVLAAGHDMWVVEATETRAIVRGKRRGSEHVQESIWTMDRARALGIAGKDNWRKQPGVMLIARASGECARLIAADAILGIPYSSEELDDGIESTMTAGSSTSTSKASARRTAQRRTAQQPAIARPPVEVANDAPPEPDFEPAGSESPRDAAGPQSGAESGAASGFESQPASDAPGITRAQSTKLHAVFGDLAVTERPHKLRIVSALIGRPVGSSSEVTKDEATTLIDTLESIATRDDPAENLAFIVEAAEATNDAAGD